MGKFRIIEAYSRVCVAIGSLAAASVMGAAPATSHTPLRQMPRAVPAAPIQLVRRDIIRISRTTRICVETSVDPEAKIVVEASGESLGPGQLGAYTASLTDVLNREFESRGWPWSSSLDSPRPLIIRDEHIRNDPEACYDRPDTIRVEQRIQSRPSHTGYRVFLTATQAGSIYRLYIDRAETVTVTGEMRYSAREDATVVSGKLFWDAYRDTIRLNRQFLSDLLWEPSR